MAIQDPGDGSNNISRGSFNIRDIKKAFAGAFDLLTNRCFELHSATFKDRLGKSILGNVIKYRGKARDFKDERGLVLNKAIIENENYHKKRSRIIHDEDFAEDTVTSTATATTTDDDYEITNPPAKKAKIEENLKVNRPREIVERHISLSLAKMMMKMDIILIPFNMCLFV